MVERERNEGPIDPTSLYFQEVGRAPLLMREQEIELAKLYHEGRKAEARLKKLENDGLRPEERQELESLIAQGQGARDRFVASNLRLVISIAERYRGLGMTFLDLIQEGNVGLMRAVERFDPERGNKFSTYATWWIRQAVSRAVADKGRTIRLPMRRVELLYNIGKARRNLTAQLNREPTPEEIARQLGKKSEVVEEVLRQAAPPISLDQEIREETSLGEMIEDKETSLPLQESEQILLSAEIGRQIETLTKREKRVLELRFGLTDGKERTLGEVGEEFGLTRERVRQIQAEALRKLRHPSRARGLKNYLEKG